MQDMMITLAVGFDAAGFFDWFVANAGYWLVFVFMVIESSFVPFPSEVVVPPAAYLATTQGSSSDMNIYLIVLVATAGAVVGALVNYYLSMWVGRPLVYRFADSRWGHACLIDRAKVVKAERYFDRHGAISTFLGRLIPAVRQLISIPAGIARMNIGRFIIFTALGAGLWNAVLALLGWWLGRTVPLSHLYAMVERYNSYLSFIGLGIALICVAVIVYNAFFKHRPHNA